LLKTKLCAKSSFHIVPVLHIRRPGMAFLARLGELVQDTAKKVQETVSSANQKRSIIVHVVNSTSHTLRWVQDYPSVGSNCSSLEGLNSGRELPPNHAGTVEISGPLAALGGAVHLELGQERLMLGAALQAGIKRFKVELGGSAPPQDFFRLMPMEVMGRTAGASKWAQGASTRCVAFVLDVLDDLSEAQVVLTEESRIGELEVLAEVGVLDGLQQLRLAEWCLESRSYWKVAGNVLFLAECIATERGMSGCRLEDQAFALDLLLAAFVTSSVLTDVPKDAFEANLKRYEEFGGPPVTGTDSYVSYRAWALSAGPGPLERRILAGRSLLRAVTMRCAAAISKAFHECRVAGELGETRSDRAKELMTALNGVKVGAPAATADSNEPVGTSLRNGLGLSKEQALALATRKANEGRVAADIALQTAMARLTGAGAHIDTSTFIKELVGFCISTSTDFAKRRMAAFIDLARKQPDQTRAKLVEAFGEHAPLLRRSFERGFKKADGSAEMGVRFECFSTEVWGGSAASASADQVLASLSRGAEDLEGKTTNSMSGEFFFQSRDGRFFAKTISEPEGDLLRLMAPAYRAHMRKNPRSLINRYAGLFRVEAPGLPAKYFIVMRSVFDPSIMGRDDEVYDLKGSMVNRKMQPGQSVGKDEDWVLAGDPRRLQLPLAIRSQLCAVHSEDLKFLLEFGVMDYSVLVGVHRYPSAQPRVSAGWRPEGGLWSTNRDEVYFVGIIDHLVRYDLGRTWQNLKEGDDAEIVRPDKYAARQVSWFRVNVVSTVETAEDFGTAGLLTISDIRGHTISPQGLLGKMMKAGDGMGLNMRDTTLAPYVTATLGLRSASTQAVESANPDWRSWPLHLPVNAADCSEVDDTWLMLEVKQRTRTPALKGDDVLGRMRVKLRDIIQAAKLANKPLTLQHKRLEDCMDSELSLQMFFQPTPTPISNDDALIGDYSVDGDNPAQQCSCVIC
jgi:hypothetical protein